MRTILAPDDDPDERLDREARQSDPLFDSRTPTSAKPVEWRETILRTGEMFESTSELLDRLDAADPRCLPRS